MIIKEEGWEACDDRVSPYSSQLRDEPDQDDGDDPDYQVDFSKFIFGF